MPKIEIPPSEALYPVPIVLVSCVDKNENKPDIITIAWCGVVCSKPALLSVSIRPSRYSHKLISETGDFVINIPSRDILKKVDFCGTHSGSDTDKFESCTFTALKASIVRSPIIKECPVNIECRLFKTVSLGSHDMFIGQVVCVHADNNLIDSKGNIDYDKAAPVVYNQGSYWDLGKKIGFYGYSNK